MRKNKIHQKFKLVDVLSYVWIELDLGKILTIKLISEAAQ